MLKFIYRKLAHALLIMFGVVSLVFLLFHALPGDPVAMMAGQRSDIQTRRVIEKELGLNKPLYQQYLYFLNDIAPLSIHKDTPDNQTKYEYFPVLPYENERVVVLKKPFLRRSFQTNRRVDEIIMENVDDTIVLALTAMMVASVIGVGMGVWAAVNKGSSVDRLLTVFSVMGISIPSYVAAVVIAMTFGYYFSDYTGLNLTGQLWQTHPLRGRELHLEHLVLPAITLSIIPLAIITQLTRSSMIEVMEMDYIRTARAKGLSKRRILIKHALKNALNPVITAVSGWLASLMAGAFFIEYIFDWKGIGYTTIKAVQNLDFPVVMGCTIFIAAAFVFINIFVDIMYALLDPRVRISK